MKIGLVSALMKDNSIEDQLREIEYYISLCKDYDLLCFGESFLHGFRGLTWNYEEDIKRALDRSGPVITYLRELSKKYSCGLSFGFIEKKDGNIYSSNMVIDSEGQIIDIFRRVSPGWKREKTSDKYKEGDGFHSFYYEDKKLSVAICGDLWFDKYLSQMEDQEIDLLLWPIYVDFPVEVWEKEHRDDYAKRVENILAPTLLINSFVEDPKRANGGAYVFHKGKIVKSLPFGKKGVLEFNI